MQLTQSANRQNGEFEAAHFRPPKGRIKRCCINQLYIYLTLITITFSYFCSEETLKGCTVRHSPYIVVTPISNIQKGEFEAAHCRKANLKRHTAARLPKGRIERFRINQPYIYLTLITSTFSCFCSEETSKGCAVRHSPYTVVTLITNIQKGEFEAGHTRRPHGKAPCTLGGGTRGFPLGYNSEAI